MNIKILTFRAGFFQCANQKVGSPADQGTDRVCPNTHRQHIEPKQTYFHCKRKGQKKNNSGYKDFCKILQPRGPQIAQLQKLWLLILGKTEQCLMGHTGLPLPQTALKGPAVACVKGYQGFPNIHSILIGICQAAFKYQ